MLVRRATRNDIAHFAKDTLSPTMKAWVGEVDGEPVALGGIALVNGRWLAFCDLTDEARQYKMTIARTALRIFEDVKRQGIKRVYAGLDHTEPTALQWITRLGFKQDHRGVNLYQWRG